MTALVRAGVALHVAHTNADVADPGVSDALAGALGLADLRPLVPAAPERARQDRHVRPRGRRRPRWSTRWPPREPAGSATTALRVRLRGHRARSRRWPARTRRSARVGSRSRWRRPGSRWCSPRAGVPPWSRPCAPRTPTRSPPSTSSSWRRPAGQPRAGPDRRAGQPGGTLRELRRARAAALPRDRRSGCGSGATRTGRCARSRCAGERATPRSTRCGRPASTPTSPPTCGTTRRPRRSSTAARRWSTSATGPASGPGWPTASGCSAAGSATGRYGGDAGVPARHRSVGCPHRRPERGDPLKAAPADQQRLLDVQALDTGLDQLAHRRRTLPEHARADRARRPAGRAARPAGRGRDRAERPRTASRRRPSATSTRSAPGPSATSSASTPARSPRPRSWRACSTRSPPSPTGRAPSRTSCWRSWSGWSRRRAAAPS